MNGNNINVSKKNVNDDIILYFCRSASYIYICMYVVYLYMTYIQSVRRTHYTVT